MRNTDLKVGMWLIPKAQKVNIFKNELGLIFFDAYFSFRFHFFFIPQELWWIIKKRLVYVWIILGDFTGKLCDYILKKSQIIITFVILE